MRIFGLEITRVKERALSAVNSARGWFNVVREGFAGAFQQNVVADSQQDILAFSGVFAPLTLIASDIAKLRLRLVEKVDKIWQEVQTQTLYLGVLTDPNRYQNRIQFVEHWILSKLLFGNTYVLLHRDKDGIVVTMYILDAQRVTPLVATSGDVYYRLSADHLSGLVEPVTVPASEIIHDRMNCLFHPLVGVSPIYACALSATMGRRIQANSAKFFQNMSRPSGMLTAPAAIEDETAARLKESWEENFSGDNLGRLAVLGDGLKYEAMTIPAEQAQLIEQLEWTSRDIAACFHMPLYKVGGPVPSGNSVEALSQQYYSDCLQSLIESAELCLCKGLRLPFGLEAEFDLEGLLRMDTAARYEANNSAVKGGWMAPNEARRRENMKPVAGGDSPMIQQQNYSLAALAKRDAQPDPFATAKPALPLPAPPTGEPEQDEAAAKSAELIDYINKELKP
jgi:HK97 family phage portal protein